MDLSPATGHSRAEVAVVSLNVAPDSHPTLKYARLGPMAMASHRRFCSRHGYAFYDAGPPATDRHPCWGKIPAILKVLERHRWVLWADSDAIAAEDAPNLESLCDPDCDIVTQCPRRFVSDLNPAGNVRFNTAPVNTGVFLTQATPNSIDLLRRTFAETQFVTKGAIWNGIGDQEAMAAVLLGEQGSRYRVRQVDLLQRHPGAHCAGNRFLHFYGDRARHHVSSSIVESVLARWEAAIALGLPLPADRGLFHWCCIQNKSAEAAFHRGDPERFLYDPGFIETAT
ncbi:MAG: hypothetical protein AB7I19_11210 [Planctomycetota bacterium]